jgi:hypothetical protein
MRNEIYQRVFSDMKEIFPEKPWLAVMERNGQPMFATMDISILFSNSVSYGLYLLDHKKIEELDQYEYDCVLESLAFCWTSIAFLKKINSSKIEKYKKRIYASFSNSSDLLSLKFEMLVFSMVSSKYEVDIKDGDVGSDTYDFLVHQNERSIKLECKSFTYDKSLIIKANAANKLLTDIIANIHKDTNSKNILFCSTIEIKNKISDKLDSVKLSNIINQCMKGGVPEINEFYTLHVDKIDISNLTDDEVEAKFAKINYGVEIACMTSIRNNDGNLFCVKICVSNIDYFVDELRKVIQKAFKNQIKDGNSSLALFFSNTELFRLIETNLKFKSMVSKILDKENVNSLILVTNLFAEELQSFPFIGYALSIKEYLSSSKYSAKLITT